jgi:23S rRNA (uracil1939-C5)-methyltransferase
LAQEFDVSVAKSAHSSAKPDPSSRSRRAPELQSSSRGVELAVPPEAFRQVNWNINRVLVERVLELVSEHRIEHFIELYAGAGNFTIPLVARGLSGVAVESNAAAADALRARACGYAPRLRVLTGDARRCLAELLAEGAHADLTLLDPPRAGARDVLADLIALAPAHIAICACDPVTLARDLRTLLGAGYELELLEGYDMFPQTHHVEALVWLKRRVTASERPRSPVSDP